MDKYVLIYQTKPTFPLLSQADKLDHVVQLMKVMVVMCEEDIPVTDRNETNPHQET